VDAFATAADLTAYLPASAVLDADDAARILDRATEVVAEAVTTGYYVDDNGNATDDSVIEALRKACCAQVEQWLEVGEENDISGYSRSATMSVGGLNLSELPSTLAPRARRTLRLAGLTGAVAF
jgi:hypothetical protein